MKLKRRRSEEPEINVISLIDVVLLLVVFFMLSSNFTSEGRLRVRLPSANTEAAERASGALTVTVSSTGTYLVNGRELVNAGADTLRAAIEKTAGSANRNLPVTIRADGRATHQSVVTAMDVLGRLGFTQMNVATVNDSGTASP